ncbi:MAG: hypothetical protein ACWGMY_03300, partial [Hyphomicrobiaceae bacterium]
MMVAFFQPGESRQVAVTPVRIGPRRAKRAAVSALSALVLLVRVAGWRFPRLYPLITSSLTD